MKSDSYEHQPFAVLVTYLLNQKKLSQNQFSCRANLSPDYVSKLVNGQIAQPRQATLDKIARGFEITKEELLELASNLSNDLTNDETKIESLPDSSFVGRESVIAYLKNIVSQGEKLILIYARGGVGKTTLARNYLKQQFGSFLEFRIAKETQDVASVESLLSEKLRELGEEAESDFNISLDRLKRKIKTQRVGILIDNLESLLDGNGRFIEHHRRYVELLRVLAEPEVQSVTMITSREPLGEAVDIVNYPLPNLDQQAWRDFWSIHNIDIDPRILGEMHQAYNGNALAMKVLISPIKRSGSMSAYWQEHKIQGEILLELSVENLIKEQFDRLNRVAKEAYKLLCRLGCYRYQDIPTITHEALSCLLWEIPSLTERIRVIRLLQDRFLVEYKNGQYSLHPIIRLESINRLRASKDWEIANRKIAEFWTNSVNKIASQDDSLKAFEAYYHYIAIEDWFSACNVIVKKRENVLQSKLKESILLIDSLGNSFCRFGLLEKMIDATEMLRRYKQLPPIFYSSKIYNVLGDLYLPFGLVKESLKCHIESRRIAMYCGSKYLELASFVNEALCRIALGEYEQAVELLENVINYDSGSWYNQEEDRFVVIAWSLLAYSYSCLDKEDKSMEFCRRSSDNLDTLQLGIQGKGYRLIFLGLAYKNLGFNEKSREMYSAALSFAEDSGYSQVKAQALTGIAELDRAMEDCESAINKHTEAINLLKSIKGNYDLAEAYFQKGLTCKKIKDVEGSQAGFQKSLRLFRKMEAWHQAKKVVEVMENKFPIVVKFDRDKVVSSLSSKRNTVMKSSSTEKIPLLTHEIDEKIGVEFFDNKEELIEYKQEVYDSGLLDELREKAKDFGQTVKGKTYRGYDYELADIGIEEGIYVYSVIRKIKPEKAVETGVCNGFSTAFILLALDKNETGQLYSIDFPEVAEFDYEPGTFWEGKRGAVIPKDKEAGWAIPKHLKTRWNLTIGRSQEKLPELLAKLGAIDFFIHDSEHSYECQWFECNESYPFLREGGILMVDDMGWNNSFNNFAEEKGKNLITIGHDLGFLVK